MKKISLLGCGLVGAFIAKELYKIEDIDLTIYDYNLDNINIKSDIVDDLDFKKLDLSKPNNLKKATQGADIVINALPGSLGYKALEVSIKNKCKVVDISFMPENFEDLNDLAIKNKTSAVVDFGFAPGVCHMVVAKHMRDLQYLDQSTIWVGGLPQREEDEYKAVFSPIDVVEEYTRSARFRSANMLMTELPFACKYINSRRSDIDNIVGFASDGLRSLLRLPIPNLFEYTYRYEKHFNKMKNLMEDGFFKPENIEATAKILTEKWKMPLDYDDISILDVYSSRGDTEIMFSMTDVATEEDHSMARTTGLPVIALVRMFLKGYNPKPGVIVPEKTDEKVLQNVLEIYQEYGIMFSETKKGV
jgi:lysine 6-dehydrogenase